MKMKLMINNEIFAILHYKIRIKSLNQFKFEYGWLPAKKNFVQPWPPTTNFSAHYRLQIQLNIIT